MTIRAIIVDDEPLARRRIRDLVATSSDIEVVAECANGRDAIEAIESSVPDLLFLDIQMPEVDGFEVLETIGVGRVPVVVFVTSYDQFAVKAFEAQALDYLMKPFDDRRFMTTLQRARAQLGDREASDVDRRLRALLEEVRGNKGYLKRLAVPVGNRSVFIRARDIDWIGAERNYIRVYSGGKGICCARVSLISRVSWILRCFAGFIDRQSSTSTAFSPSKRHFAASTL